jgi:hypothetical protein
MRWIGVFMYEVKHWYGGESARGEGFSIEAETREEMEEILKERIKKKEVEVDEGLSRERGAPLRISPVRAERIKSQDEIDKEIRRSMENAEEYRKEDLAKRAERSPLSREAIKNLIRLCYKKVILGEVEVNLEGSIVCSLEGSDPDQYDWFKDTIVKEAGLTWVFDADEPGSYYNEWSDIKDELEKEVQEELAKFLGV